MTLGGLKDQLVAALMTSAMLGGGSVVIANNIAIARHDERITRIEALDKSIGDLRDDLRITREQMIAVEARGDTRDTAQNLRQVTQDARQLRQEN